MGEAGKRLRTSTVFTNFVCISNINRNSGIPTECACACKTPEDIGHYSQAISVTTDEF